MSAYLQSNGDTVINLDGAYINDGFRDNSDITNKDETSESDDLIYDDWAKTSNVHQPFNGSVAAGCGVVAVGSSVTSTGADDSHLYSSTGDLIAAYIKSGVVAIGSNRVVSVNHSTQTGYIYNLSADQLATFTPFTGGYWGSSYTTNETNQGFGETIGSVAVGCGRIVVGAYKWDGPVSASNLNQSSSQVGTVYIYDLDGTAIKKIESPWYQSGSYIDPVGSYFGSSVAVGNGRIVVGAPRHEVGATSNSVTDSGRVFIYSLDGTLLRDISREDYSHATNDYFGESVDIGCGRIVIGAPGVGNNGLAQVYDRNGDHIIDLSDNGAENVHGSSSGADFGSQVAIGSDLIAVGAKSDDPGRISASSGTALGSIFLYNLRYTKIHELAPFTYPQYSPYFGVGISIGSNDVLVASWPTVNRVHLWYTPGNSNSYWETIADGYFYY